MNRLAFQTYGTKKLSIFQSVWDTTKNSVVSITELANTAATTPLPVGWAGTNLLTGGYTHTAGNTASLLVNNLTPTAGQSYQVICTLSGTGSVVINWGGMSSVAISATTTITLTPINATSKLSIIPSNDFVGTVSLSIKTSSSATNQIQLPISIASGKSVWVDWGDGQYSTANSTNVTANRIHTYAASGEYPVRVFGDDFSFGFANPSNTINDRLKIKSISSWGKLKLGTLSFYGCSNVTMSGITDVPDLTGVTSLNSTFYDCREITTIGRINEWNTSSLIDASSLFRGCYKFNSDISNWNVSNVTNMFAMLYDARAFNQPIGNWERSTPGNVSTMNKVTSTRSMFSDAYAFNQNIGTWNVSNVLDMGYMFRRAYAFNQNLSNWNVTKVAIFENMFESATAFNNGFASGVANQLPWTINTSPTASVIMGTMFNGATSFNSNLGTGTTPWDVSKVINMASMFQGAANFRNGDDAAPINNWSINTVSSVTMASMFQSASNFNRDVSNWNITKVINTSSMFYQASAFNQPIGSWNVSNVTNMGNMFQNATSFNQPIGSWNVSNVTNMNNMFNSTQAFNQPINSWNTVSVLGMVGMFELATAFNQPIDNWNMTNVTSTQFMFNGAFAFNQPLANWERVGSTLANVTSMNNMFSGTSAFNQPIGNWNVSKVTNFTSFMLNKTPATFSSTNLDVIYNGWIVNNVKPNITISFGTAKYSQAGKPGKDTLLTSPNNWTIVDGLLTVSGTSNNGGLIRVTTTAAHGFTTGNSVYIYGVNGTTNANGTWTVTVVNTTVIELQGSTYNAEWTSGGNVILP